MKRAFLSPLVFLGLSAAAPAATIPFDLQGQAGFGLLPGNETSPVAGTPGTGGETGAGISYDDVSNVLTINIGWGVLNGFTDLTGNATMGHIHGPTASGGTASFTQSAGIRYVLDSQPGWTASATSGGFLGTVTIAEADEPALLNGQMYINIHTFTNPGGEIRGNLVVVPEPSPVGLGLLAAGTLLLLRRRLRR
jgi:hypothetical protein